MGSTRLILRGIKNLQKHLQVNGSAFRAAPTLLIVNENPDEDLTLSTPTTETSKLIQFMLAQQMGFRTIVAKQKNAYVTEKDIETALGLLSRTGASSVAAVGESNTIHLAKAITNLKPVEQSLLIPTSYEAVLFAPARSAIVLDTKEETLVSHQIGRPDNEIIVALESSKMNATKAQNALLTLVFLAVEQASRVHTENNRTVLDDYQHLSPEDHDAILDGLLHMGEQLDFGMKGNERRSIALAIASSFLPVFPEHDMLSFTASLLPSFASMNDISLTKSLVDSAPLLLMKEPLNDLIKYIRDNRTAQNCLDVKDENFRELLIPHIIN